MLGYLRRALASLFACSMQVVACCRAEDRPPTPSLVVEAATRDPHVARIAALGDTGMGNEGQLRVGEALARRCQQQGCDLVLLLGDNVYPSGATSPDDPVFERVFEAPYAGVDAPFYAVLGNHDCGGNGTGHDFERGENEIAHTTHSRRWRLPAHTYLLRAGPVDLLALDTNLAFYERDQAQRTLLRSWLDAPRARPRLAFGHHPYLSNGVHGDAGRYDRVPRVVPYAHGDGVRTLVERELCGKVDAYLSGHDHSRQWLEQTCQGTHLLVSGAGAASTRLEGHHRARFQSLGLGFAYLVIDAHRIHVEWVDDHGETEHQGDIEARICPHSADAATVGLTSCPDPAAP